ncbi:MAG TPA: hypothetical protein VKA53_07050, partial [Thermoanaerobaculia bacterium]|nr:hypothetical protein [Thermoanaerobaculia bacterium]
MRRLKFSFHIFLLTFLVLGLVMASSAVAQDEAPGTISATGTSFVTSGPAGDFSFTTTDSVTAGIMTMPDEFINFVLLGVEGVTATDLTISGLTPGHTYWLYANKVIEPVVIDASAEGTITISLDVSEAVERWIQPKHSTLLLMADGLKDTTGQSFAGATWDATTQTATLTGDVSETIRILQDGATLDGAGYCASVDAPYGIRMEGQDITVKNVVVHAQNVGVAVRGALLDSRISADPSVAGSAGLQLPSWGANIIIIGGGGPNVPTDTAFVTGCEVSGYFPFSSAPRKGRYFGVDGLTIYNNNFFG